MIKSLIDLCISMKFLTNYSEYEIENHPILPLLTHFILEKISAKLFLDSL